MEDFTKQTKEYKTEQVSDRRAAYRRKTHTAMFYVALIFGIPAAIAAVVGTRIDARYGTGKAAVLSLLSATFILSWLVVIRMYRRMMREITELDARERGSAE